MRTTDEILRQELGDQVNKYPSLNNIQTYEPRVFAKNSQFFNQVMEDGNIFNPYIHRRWLPVEFEELYNAAINSNLELEDVYERKYNHVNYVIPFVIGEVNRLYMLSKYDPKAYEERSKFFTPDVVSNILLPYVVGMNRSINISGRVMGSYVRTTCFKPKKKSSFIIDERGRVNEITTCVVDCTTEMEQCERLLKNPKTLYEIYKACQTLRKIEFFNDCMYTEVWKEFYKTFLKAGVYYTLKHNIMFRGWHEEGKKREDLERLRRSLESISTQVYITTYEELRKIYE